MEVEPLHPLQIEGDRDLVRARVRVSVRVRVWVRV